jgi:hypothetical protein
VAGAADPDLVRRLRAAAAVFVPRMRDRSVECPEARSIADRPHRRHLHQHPDAEAVRARARGGRLCPLAVEQPYRLFHASLRLNTLFSARLSR